MHDAVGLLPHDVFVCLSVRHYETYREIRLEIMWMCLLCPAGEKPFICRQCGKAFSQSVVSVAKLSVSLPTSSLTVANTPASSRSRVKFVPGCSSARSIFVVTRTPNTDTETLTSQTIRPLAKHEPPPRSLLYT